MKYYAGIGARETPSHICLEMTSIAKILSNMQYILRSGAADGADSAFEAGCHDITKKEIFLPKDGFNGRWISHSTPYLKLATKEMIPIAAKYHPKWDQLTQSAKNFHTRNVGQVLGSDCNTPVDFVVCWTADGKASGGTGQAMRIALDRNIPICNLKVTNFSMFIKTQGLE